MKLDFICILVISNAMVYDHDHDDRITRVDISHPENIFMVNTNFMKYSGIQSKSVCQNIPEVFQSLHFVDNEYKSTSFRFATGLDKYIRIVCINVDIDKKNHVTYPSHF